MDEALDLGLFGGGEYRAGAGDIACFKPARVRGIDHAGDVNQGIRAFCQQVQTGLFVECARDPAYSITALLRPAGEGAHLMTRGQGLFEQASPDEAGRAGNGQLQIGDHSIGSPGPSSSTCSALIRSSSASSTDSMPISPAALIG